MTDSARTSSWSGDSKNYWVWDSDVGSWHEMCYGKIHSAPSATSTEAHRASVGRTVWGPKVPTLKETEGSFFYVQCFLYLISPLINVSIFHNIWLDSLWTDLICLHVEIVSLMFHCPLKHYHCNNLLTDSVQWYMSNDGTIKKLIYI